MICELRIYEIKYANNINWILRLVNNIRDVNNVIVKVSYVNCNIIEILIL